MWNRAPNCIACQKSRAAFTVTRALACASILTSTPAPIRISRLAIATANSVFHCRRWVSITPKRAASRIWSWPVRFHIGSQITETAPFVEAAYKLAAIVRDLSADGVALKYLDLGGGLGIPYQEEPPAPAEYAAALLGPLRGLGVKIIIEPGRVLVGNAGILVTRVLYMKETDVKRFVVVDAAMNDLIRPVLYEAYHEIRPVEQRRDASMQIADVVGPVCESGDFFARERELPNVQAGDLLAVMSAGTYGFVMASNYNSRPRAPEIIVDGARFHVVRERESFDDLVRGERIVHFGRGPMPKLPFVKMHGCGNDYVYIVADRIRPADPISFARRVSDRRFGIGGDGLIMLCPTADADVRMEMYNADGSRGEMCGNGIRCLARLYYEGAGGHKNPIAIATDCGIKTRDADCWRRSGCRHRRYGRANPRRPRHSSRAIAGG